SQLQRVFAHPLVNRPFALDTVITKTPGGFHVEWYLTKQQMARLQANPLLNETHIFAEIAEKVGDECFQAWDLRGPGSQVVRAGSVHYCDEKCFEECKKAGKAYEYLDGFAPCQRLERICAVRELLKQFMAADC